MPRGMKVGKTDYSVGRGGAKPRTSAFDSAVLGESFQADQPMYDSFSDKAYSQATRTLDPYFDRMKGRFEQDLVNKGISAGSDAYETAFDRYMRQENDAYNQAAFGAMQYGANRLDADRNFDEAGRQFDASLSEGGRRADMSDATSRYGIDTSAQTARNEIAERGRQFDDSFGLQELMTYEGIADGYRDDAYRDAVFNTSLDQQQFNNLLQAMSLVPGANFVPANIGGAFNNALQGEIYNNNLTNSMYQGLGEALMAGGDAWAEYRENRP